MSVIAFRVDASTQIGSGHLMRCLTLANVLQKEGAEIHLISRHIPEEYRALVKQKGMILHILPSATKVSKKSAKDPVHAAWLGTDWKTDRDDCIQALSDIKKRVELLVVDHYGLDARFETAVRAHVDKILVIDDLADRPHDCDILLDHNYYRGYETRYQSLLPRHALCLLGPQHALLRPEFSEARTKFPRQERPLAPVRRVNICFGGVDAKADTIKALEALTPWLADKSLQIDVIVNAASPQLKSIQTWAEKYEAITLHISPANVAELLAVADIGIGAVGTMIWERACVGLPAITIAIADNQLHLAEDTSRAGIHLFAGESDQVSVESLRTNINFLLNNPYLRQHLADVSLSMTDGRGAKRVASCIFTSKISLRIATSADCADIYNWRNDPVNRRYSHDSQTISYQDHQAWFEKTLQIESRVLLIASDNKGPLGVLRFDCKESNCLTSVYLVPGRHGEGLGAPLLREGLKWLQANRKGLLAVHAEVQPENIASKIVFERAGFKKQFSTFVTEITS